MDDKLKQLIDELLVLALEGNAADDQLEQLNSLIRSDREVLDYCSSFIELASRLYVPDQISMQFVKQDIDDARVYANTLQELKHFEETASVVTLNEDSIGCEICSDDRNNVKPNRFFSIYNKLISVAAVFMLMFIIYANVFPPELSVFVATVQDQVDVVWNNDSEKLKNNDRVFNNQLPYQIENGILEIQYDTGVDIVIEAPAKFQFERAGIFLEYGRLYSRVPVSGIGFRVDTPGCRFIDLGTEFGIQADTDGSSEMHVVKGKVHMDAGESKYSKTIYEFSASRYNAETGQVSDVCYNSGLFARNIESKNNRIWRGEKAVNLADIVGGGNGFGTGQFEHGVDPGTGRAFILLPEHADDIANASNGYHLCPDFPLIDGVFVPNAADGKQVITSLGHIYADCPITNSNYFGRIVNGTAVTISRGGPGLFLNNTYFGDSQNPAIFMHTNQGITFDLKLIRKVADSTDFLCFKSICGISETGPDYGLADITVLVDGRVRYNQKNIAKAQFFQVNVPLYPNDRFLTLMSTVSTEKKAPEDGKLNLEHGDWCLFGNPILKLK